MSDDRSKFLGGSDAPAVLGVSPWKTRYQLWLSKIAQAATEPLDPAREKLFARGKRFEPLVIDMLCEEKGIASVPRTARNVRHQDIEHDFLSCEIDAELQLDGRIVNAEIKTVSTFAASDWGEPGTDEIPLHVAVQTLHGLMVTGRERSIIAALIGGDDLRIYEVRRDEELITKIRTQEVAFWNDHVLAGVAPDPVTAEDLKIRYPKDSGPAIEASEEIAHAVVALSHMKQEHKRNEKQITEVENRVKAFMGESPALLYKGARLATWSLQRRAEFTVAASEFRVLRIKKPKGED